MEILVVMVIIAILAAASFPIVKIVWRKSAESTTRATIARITEGMEGFRKDWGYYPQHAPANTTDIDGHRLTVAMVDGWKRPGTGGAYVDTSTLKTKGGFVVDGWQRPLRWRSPGIVNAGTYDVWSAGADGVDGTGDPDLMTALTRSTTDDVTTWRQ